MALHASELRRRLGELVALLAPAPGRLEFSVRLALICALTTLVAQLYETPEPALTTYVAFFLVRPDRVTSVLLSATMMLVMALIVAGLILIGGLVVDQWFWLLMSMATISYTFVFLASASRLRPIAGIIALIAVYVLTGLGNIQIGELVTRALLYAWLLVGIPAGVSIVVNLLLGPAPRRLAERMLAHRLTIASQMLQGADHHTRSVFANALTEGDENIQHWLGMAALERTSPARDIAALRNATRSLTPLMLLVDLATRNDAQPLPAPLRRRIADTLNEMAAILTSGGYPIDVAIALDADDASGDVAPTVAEFDAILLGFTADPDAATPAPTSTQGGFFVPDAFTNPEHVRYAVKTTGAALFCYLAYSLMNYPGIHTCMLTCYIVALGTAAETVEKSSLRMTGCLVGAAAGIAAIVYLIPHVVSIGALLGIVFVGTFVSAWIAAGGPRISYSGFQVALAFLMCVVQGSAPAFDLTIARDRVIGVLFGVLVVYLIFTHIWPVSIAQRIDPAIAAALRRLSAMVAATTRPGRAACAGEAQTALGAIERSLDLMRYEPSAVRPTADWLQARWQAARAIAALGAPLFLYADRNGPFRGKLADRLEHLAARFDKTSAKASQQADFATVQLDPQIAAPLQDLELALDQRSAGLETHGYASA